jgi:ankyrin repeat protein
MTIHAAGASAENLFDAIYADDIATVAALVDAHPELLTAMHWYYHHLPLHHAAYWGKTAIAELLLSRGADVHARCGLGRTPLHASSVDGTPGVTALLISHGADVHARDDWGATPLFYVRSAAVAELLIDCGADVNALRQDGVAVLNGPVERENTDLLRLLLKHGANPNYKDRFGWTLLMRAVWKGYPEVADILLEFGAETKDPNGGTLLHVAAAGGHLPMVEHLLKRGADVNARDNLGLTPLHEVASLCQPDEGPAIQPVVECLIAHGADVNLGDNDGRTCVHAALENGVQWLYEYLLRHGGKHDGKE